LLGGEIVDGLPQTDPAATAGVDAIEHLIEGGPLGELTQFAEQVLLQRLMILLGASLQRRVYLVGHVSH
jgi:hypothetical protein